MSSEIIVFLIFGGGVLCSLSLLLWLVWQMGREESLKKRRT